MSDAQALADAVEAFQNAYLPSAIRETSEWQSVLAIVSELEVLSGVEVEQECALQEAAFVHGARSMREMLARFVETSPPTNLAVVAGSMRANWHPGWGMDPGKLDGSIPHNALGETPEFYERNFDASQPSQEQS